MSLTRKQMSTMAVIVVAGLLAAAGVLLVDRRATEAASPETEAVTPAASAASAPRTVRLDDAQVRAAGIATQPAGPGRLRSIARFHGEVRFDEDRTAHVVPRLAGVAEAVPARLGETVKRGQLLAVVASTALSELRSELLGAQRRRDAARATFDREQTLWERRISAEQDYRQARTALQEAGIAVENARQKLAAVGAGAGTPGALNRLEIRAPFDGTIVEKHLAPGEAVTEDARIFTLADLRTVWAEFAVPAQDLEAVRTGREVVVSSTAFDRTVAGTVSYVGALLGEQTRTARARVTLANPQGAWRPGLFVTVAVQGDDEAAPLVVPAVALQAVDERPVVFKAVPGGFVATPVRTGRADGTNVEVLQGLRAGDAVATTNAFVLTADLGKSGVAEE